MSAYNVGVDPDMPQVEIYRPSGFIDPAAPMCQCGHTRASHDEWLRCFACAGPPCDAPGVTVKYRKHAKTWTWNLRCERHGALQVNGPIDDWEPDAAALFRREHAGHIHPD